MPPDPPRPLLLPQNRRLRHLQGIYIRNLTLSSQNPLQTSTDDIDILLSPTSKHIPGHGLHHAHSTSSLRPQHPRRRSTNWASSTPDIRNRKLEDVIENRMADCFFSLNVIGEEKGDGGKDGDEEPVYISEVIERASNPSFRDFDLAEGVGRRDRVVIKVWVKGRKGNWVMLIEEEIWLRGLKWVGGLEDRGFGENEVLVRLVDGVYALNGEERVVKGERKKDTMGGREEKTSSYSALMRLSNLDESIQDALATREELAGQINAILKERKLDESPQAEEDVKLATKYVATERKQLKASLRRRAELKASILARSKAIETGNSVQTKVLDDITNAQVKLTQCRTLLKDTTTSIHNQRRRICEELTSIFPIEPSTHPLLFTICSLPLPNSIFDDHTNEDLISSALGHVAHLVNLLQYYLSVPLTYPITPYGSRSIIQDTISILQDNQRTFPLYMKGTVRFRFDYAVFLLNKDIECLAESQGLKVLDIRQTLPNLKYLLYVASAGTSELPDRKKGGIRGLLMMGERGSRRGSEDSGVGVGEARRALERESESNGKAVEVKDENAFGVRTLRTSGLRENVR